MFRLCYGLDRELKRGKIKKQGSAGPVALNGRLDCTGHRLG